MAIVVVAVQSAGAVAEPSTEAEETEREDEDVVVVTAEEPLPERASESSMDRRTIEAVGARSAQDVLRSAPGVQLSQHGSEGKAAQFFMRGFDAAHGTDVTVGVDGLVFNEPSHIHGHGYADVGPVVPEAVRDVRIRKGTFDLDQGDLSTAGDVSYRLGVPADRRGVGAGGEAGWPARGRLWGTVAPEDGDPGDVVAAELVGDAGPYDNRQTRRGGLVGQQNLGDWRIRGAVQGARLGLPGALPLEDLREGRVGRGESLTPETAGSSAQGWVGVVHEDERGDWGRRTSVDVRGRQFDGEENFTGYLIDGDHGDRRREFQRAASVVLEHTTDVELHEDWRARVLAGGMVDGFGQFEDAVDGQSRPLERRRGGQGLQFAAHLAPGVTGFPTEWLDVRAGVRLEGRGFRFREDDRLGGDTDSRRFGAVAPRGAITAYPGPGWRIVAAAGRGYRSPPAGVYGRQRDDEESRDRVADADPTMTVVDGAELGVVAAPNRNLELSTTVFGHVSGAEFVYDHVARRQVDEGPTRRIGAELAGRFRHGDQFRVTGHLTAVDARFVDDRRRIPFVPPLEAGLLATGQGPAGTFGGLQWRGLSARPLPFGAQVGGWQLVDAHVGWRHDGWELRLGVENLLNTEWFEGSYHYASHFDRDRPRSTLPRTHVVAGHPRMVRVAVSHRW